MKIVLATILLVLGVESSHAQDTCKTYAHKNPHGAAMTLSRVWILDSVNFTVRPIQTLPYEESATGSFDFEVCILPRDGEKYSTQVRYMTTHGPVSYNISNFLAPMSTSSVDLSERQEVAIYPNPAGNALTVTSEANDNWSISSLSGQVVLLGSLNSDNGRIDISALPSGGYFLTLIGRTGELRSLKFVKG